MHFYYLDPGLINNVGHHANSCRLITKELASRGIPTTVLAEQRIEAPLREELNACPFFRAFTYHERAHQERDEGSLRTQANVNRHTKKTEVPITGWLEAFDANCALTIEDLFRIPEIGPDDILFLNSARPAQLMALGEWLRQLDGNRAPTALVEFATEPGVYFAPGPSGVALRIPEPHDDPRPLLYRFAAKRIATTRLSRLHMVTYDLTCSALYKSLMEREIETVPWPHSALTAPRSRRGNRPIVMSVLGHQRYDKGYHLMPEVVEGLLRNNENVEILLHNAKPEVMAETQDALRRLAQNDRRITIDERIADKSVWLELLDKSDLIICPYNILRYTTSHSTVVSESIAHAIPLVVPANTVLARVLEEYGEPGTMFKEYTASSILTASQQALDHFDFLAERAMYGSELWAERNGPGRLVDAFFKLASLRS
jgi:hypothetical protein